MTIEKVPDMLGMIEFKDTEAHLHTWYKGIDDDMNEAVRMAIETLEAEPCRDCISRQAVEAIINDIRDCISVEGYWAILERMKKLPSVNPQKIGHWIRWYKQKENDWCIENILHCKCSECGKEYDPHSSQFIKFCNECGAKMVEPQAESEDKE